MTSRIVAFEILLLVAAPAAAAPPDAKTEARQHFDAGVRHAQAGDYRAALAEFQRAYELAPRYVVLYNIGKAQEALGDAVAAVTAFQRYLAEGGAAVPAERRAKVTAAIKDLESRIGTITIHVSPDTAKVSLDGAPVDAAAAAKGIRVNWGRHLVLTTADGFVAAQREVHVDHADLYDVTLALEPVPPPATVYVPASPDRPPAPRPAPPVAAPGAILRQPAASAPEPPRGALERRIGYWLGGAGAMALAASGGLYLFALSERDKAISAGCNASVCVGEGADHWHDAQSAVTWSRIAAIAGGATFAAGAVFVLSAPSSSGAPPGVSIAGRF